MQTAKDFRWRCAPLWTATLLVLSAMTSTGRGYLFTSSDKLQTLANQEGLLLNILEAYIKEEAHLHEKNDQLKNLFTFLSVRAKAFYASSAEERTKMVGHPNGAYYLIKHFTTEWANVLKRSPAFSRRLGSVLDSLPQPTDYQGALSAIVRIHRVYKLKASDIYVGNYLGYMGPALGPLDALEVGLQAFVEGFMEESIQWLELTADRLHRQQHQTEADMTQRSRSSLVEALVLLSRAYLLVNRTEDAEQKLSESLALDPVVADLPLVREPAILQIHKTLIHPRIKNMSDLCLWDKTHRVGELRPYHVCRYKPSLYAPYARYQEEILSISPYVSVFYNFVSDSESDAFKSFVRQTMRTYQDEKTDTPLYRTCDLGWIHDTDMELAGGISQRIKDVTWLEVDQRLPGGPSSSEPFQVVNYGLGGHYDPHLDRRKVQGKPFAKSEDRIATFLLYLSDVDRGGNTAFLRAGVSVAAQKGMALFWYNFNPAMEKDEITLHAGCPVVIGHKWIMTKWILTYGNTFRRPCGPHPQSTQLDIEALMTSHVRRT